MGGLIGLIWKDKEKGLLDPKAFSEVAKNLAFKVNQEGEERGKGKKNRPSQLRKFYDVIFKLNQQARVADEDRWNAILVQLNKQLALVHYAKGRDLVTNSFVEMMDELIRCVEKPFDLQVITDFLEAFMAFYRELRPKN